jgi:hypothetical protein
MLDIEPAEPWLGSWRKVASAWVMVLIVVAAFAGFQALASLRQAPQPVARVVIPQHDPICPDSQCRGEPSPFEHFHAIW